MDRRFLRVFGFAIFCILLAGLAWYGVRWAEDFPRRMAAAAEALLETKARQLSDQFFTMAHFQPKIRVNQRIIAETTSEIAEVAVSEKQIEVVREFNHTWAGSTKTLRLSGTYVVKTGFNLLNRFEIQVEKGHRQILLPPATILSIEQKNLKVEAFENGFWNPISAEDLQSSIVALKELARTRSATLLQQTEADFAKRLYSLTNVKVEILRALP